MGCRLRWMAKPRECLAGESSRFDGLGRGCFHGLSNRAFALRDLPIAVFPGARTKCAMLGTFEHDEGRAAFRTWFRKRFVRRRVIAIGIAAAAIKNSAAPASLGRPAADEFAFAAFRAFDSESYGPRVFAFGIFRAADEFAETTVTL